MKSAIRNQGKEDHVVSYSRFNSQTNFQAFYSKDYQEAEVLHLWAGQGCKGRSTKEGRAIEERWHALAGVCRSHICKPLLNPIYLIKWYRLIPQLCQCTALLETCLFLHLLQAYYSRSLQYMADDPSTWANRALVRALVRHSTAQHSTAQLVLCAGDRWGWSWTKHRMPWRIDLKLVVRSANEIQMKC